MKIWHSVVKNGLLVALLLTLATCKRGPRLAQPIQVQLVMPLNSTVYPEDNFTYTYYDEYNFSYTGTESPHYVGSYDSEKLVEEFKQELIRLCEKNNLILVEGPCDYVLRISDLSMIESLHSEAYTDTCYTPHTTRYVYYSDLKIQATADLYRDGTLLNTWTQKGMATESVKSKTDECGKPKIRWLSRGTSWMITSVAKEIRVRLARAMDDLEG